MPLLFFTGDCNPIHYTTKSDTANEASTETYSLMPRAPCRTWASQRALQQQWRLTTEQWMDTNSVGTTCWREMPVWTVCQWLACQQQQLQSWRPCGKLRSAGTALYAIFRSPLQSRADPWLGQTGATADRLDTAGFRSTVIVNACLLNWWKKSTPRQVQHFQEAEWEDVSTTMATTLALLCILC